MIESTAEPAASHAVIYTDGSCIGNPGPGGWGVHAELADGSVVELGGGDASTTNNRMELRAAIEAARLARGLGGATIVTDSRYVQNGVTSWLNGWKRNGWKTSTGAKVENRLLWEQLDELTGKSIVWRWTRSHVGTPGNERCDRIARWFAGSIRTVGSRQPSGVEKRRKATDGSTRYLSLVDGVVQRHRTWSECERRVRGVANARFRKAASELDVKAIMQSWGLGTEERPL